jgi:hypothetical protein
MSKANPRTPHFGQRGIVLSREAIVLSREAGAVQIWQPIETAPRDGSKILLWARVHSPADATSSVMVGLFDISFGWVTASYGGTPIVPTHWMPLPNSPTSN